MMMSVPQYRWNRFPTTQFLHRLKIDPILHQPGGKCMAQVMEAQILEPAFIIAAWNALLNLPPLIFVSQLL
jgi:hypothetical protein